MVESDYESYEEKEEAKKGFFANVPTTAKNIGMIGIVGWIIFGYYFYNVSTTTLLLGPAVVFLLWYILSKQAEQSTGLLQYHESRAALEKHINYLARKNSMYKNFVITPAADLPEYDGEYRRWKHAVIYFRKSGIATIPEFWIGITEAYAPATPRLIKSEYEFTGKEIEKVKFILPANFKAAQSQGILKEMLRFGGGMM